MHYMLFSYQTGYIMRHSKENKNKQTKRKQKKQKKLKKIKKNCIRQFGSVFNKKMLNP
jgi:hypothetical protein